MNCKFCNKECKNLNSLRNHERLCPHNSERVYVSHTTKEKGYTAWNKGLSKETDGRVAKNAESLMLAYKEGRAKIQDICLISKEERSRRAIAQGLGGYQEGAGRTNKFFIEDSFGKMTCLQGTYELECATVLNNLGIMWIRPKALKYDNRNYFADFYLPDYKIYLDPKNDYKARLDSDKIEKVRQQNNVVIVVLLKDDITVEKIKSLCS
jgi:hypothetical protein